MNVLRILAPRLTYRLENGQWCDHQRHVKDLGGGQCLVSSGWDAGQLIDMGRRKLFTCLRCGYQETNLGHPVREAIGRLFKRGGENAAPW
jgi:hypothetical protein